MFVMNLCLRDAHGVVLPKQSGRIKVQRHSEEQVRFTVAYRAYSLSSQRVSEFSTRTQEEDRNVSRTVV